MKEACVFVCIAACLSQMSMTMSIYSHMLCLWMSRAMLHEWERETNQGVCRFPPSLQCLLRYHRQVFAVRFTPRCSSIHLIWYAPCCCSIHLFLEETLQLGYPSSPYNCLDTQYEAEALNLMSNFLFCLGVKMLGWFWLGRHRWDWF